MADLIPLTVPIEPELKNRLDKLAEDAHRSSPFPAALAIQEFIGLYEWQCREIQAALREADNGDFASDEEIEAVFGKWIGNEDLLAAQSPVRS